MVQHNTLPSTPQEREDVRNLVITVSLSVKTNDQIVQLNLDPVLAGPDEAEALAKAREMAEEGDTQISIGGIIVTNQEDPDGATTLEAVTRIPRHQEWMGAAPTHTMLKGLVVLVRESHHRPADLDDLPQPQAPFPAGEANLLRAVALWHGAKECVWLPDDQEDGTPRRPMAPTEPALAR